YYESVGGGMKRKTMNDDDKDVVALCRGDDKEEDNMGVESLDDL
ncbi:putative HNHc nuclease, partial [Staphylococcus saprophyticus]